MRFDLLFRRKDYLRHFVMVLCEKGLKKELCSFPYVGLLDQVTMIILPLFLQRFRMTLHLKVSKVLVSRARGADLALNNFYDILYSFHTLKGNFRQGIYIRNIIIIIIILSSCQLLFSCANAPLVWHSSVLASTRCKNRYTFLFL